MIIGKQIKLIISDFDGTLADTYKANFLSYKMAFETYGYTLLEHDYKKCFGMRYDAFMQTIGITDSYHREMIKKHKRICYPFFFNNISPNNTLISFISTFHQAGGLTALASTSSYENLIKVLNHLNIYNIFDVILSGDEVSQPKPNPEIYNTILDRLKIHPNEALIFEDSDIGIESAKNAGINFIKIDNKYYGT